MRFSILTITAAAAAAVGTQAIKTAEVPGYEPVPKAAINKYDHHVPGPVADFATGPFEPSYMPEEDLKLHARSVASAVTTAQPTSAADEPADGSYEAFVEWMESRIGREATETPESSHIARSVAPSSSTKAQVPDRPTDDTYEAFKHWMEALYPGEVSEETKQKLHARGTSTPAGHATTSTHVTTATAGPADGSYEAFKHWMKTRFPQGFSQEEEHKMLARSANEHDDYPSEEFRELNARSAEDHVQQELEWIQYWPKEEDEHLHARSTDDVPYDHEYESEHVEARSEAEGDYSYEGSFEEFLARQGINPKEFAQQSASTESHEEDPQPQAPVESAPQVSEIPATPAAAPTPKPTFAETSSAITSTSALQWTGETATTSSGSATANAQARSWYGNCILCNQLYHYKSQEIFQPSLVAKWWE
ncbi:hypothetical protein M436DRAFT_67818 [Aureobasidium namibiae CBS 147.97]|uniref:Uncharacterized protein n=1 Tax=Aureobasidium namibiae CBS 147.97 TaxID=1043004 RepID=A0A074W701_9PEZI